MTFISGTKIFFKSIINDIKEIRWYQTLFLILFGILMVIFSTIDFNYLLGNRPYLLKWDNDRDAGYVYWKRVLMTLSGVASFTGAFSVVLVSLGKLSSYFWGILNTILYGSAAFAYGYVGDAQLNLFFFLPLQFIGIYNWLKHQNDNKVSVRKLTLKTVIISVLLIGGLYPFFWWEIPAFSKLLTGYYFYQGNKIAFWFDVTTNTLSVVAQYLLNNRHREQWILWIIINCFQIAMFAGVGGFGVEFNVVCMWSFFLINSFYGLYQWYFVHELEGKNKETDIELCDSNKVLSESFHSMSDIYDNMKDNISCDSFKPE